MPQCHAVSSWVNEALNITFLEGITFVPDWLLNCFTPFFSISESRNSILDHLKTIWSLCCTMTNFGSKLFGIPIWCRGGNCWWQPCWPWGVSKCSCHQNHRPLCISAQCTVQCHCISLLFVQYNAFYALQCILCIFRATQCILNDFQYASHLTTFQCNVWYYMAEIK